MPKQRFLDQVVWLTGGSLGIGLEVLKSLLQEGATVVASARNTDSLQTLQSEYPNQLTLIPVDVTDRGAIFKAVGQIESKFGRLDIALFNAGTCVYIDMPNFNRDIVQKNFDVNFFGLVDCIEAALPLLKKANAPYLVGMSSSAAFVGLPRAEGYGASKAAVSYLMETLQVTLKPSNIDVSVICPGFVKTPLTDRNDFPMPTLMTADKAAKIIIDGMAKRKPEISFPKRLIWVLKLASILPDRMRIHLLGKLIQ